MSDRRPSCLLATWARSRARIFPAFKTPVIAVNQSLDDNTKKIVCAHELGHHILHSRTAQSCRELRFDSKAGILEREANIFAAAFLIDYDKALSLLKDGYTVDQTAAILETSTQLLNFYSHSAV